MTKEKIVRQALDVRIKALEARIAELEGLLHKANDTLQTVDFAYVTGCECDGEGEGETARSSTCLGCYISPIREELFRATLKKGDGE